MTKFVGKFRKNKNYNDDYQYEVNRHRDEHSEARKQMESLYNDLVDDYEEELDNQYED